MKNILFFDEELLMLGLQRLSDESLVVFAVAPAARQAENLDRFASGKTASESLRKVLVKISSSLPLASINKEYWSSQLEVVMDLLPLGDEGIITGSSFVDDAVSSAAYAVRCLLKSSAQEAAWAARRAYEATDEAATSLIGINPGDPEGMSRLQIERIVAEHEIVQRELKRQKRDLELLHEGVKETVLQYASDEELLSESECLALDRTN